MIAYQYKDFAPLLTEKFKVKKIDIPDYTLSYVDDGPSSLILALSSITEIPFKGFRNHIRERCFTLEFLADRELPQGTYHMNHDVLGDIEMFLVPHGPGGEGFRLAATFN